MVKFIIIRHGFSQGNKEKRFTGQMDLPLDDIGLMQAEITAKYIKENFKVDLVYSSDLIRAMQTANPIAKSFGIDIIPCKELRETNLGKWQGKLITEVAKEFPESFDMYRTSPGLTQFDGGECYATVMERVRRAMETIAKENDGKTIVITTHGGVIRCLRAAWQNISLEDIKNVPHVPNASVSVVDYDVTSGIADYNLIGYTDHLPNKTSEEGVQ